MADTTAAETPGEGSQAEPLPSNVHQPQAGAHTTSTEPQAGESQSQAAQQEPMSLEQAKKLRQEAAALRQRLKGYEDAEKKAQDAQLSEMERAKKQHADLQVEHESYKKTMQERIVRYEVERIAASLHIIDPEAAAKLLDWSELEYHEDGTPTNAEKLLKELLKNKPYLLPLPPAATPATTTTTQGTQPGAATAQQQQPASTTHMTPTLPAMNPGRAAIVPPGTATPGKPVRLTDVWSRS